MICLSPPHSRRGFFACFAKARQGRAWLRRSGQGKSRINGPSGRPVPTRTAQHSHKPVGTIHVSPVCKITFVQNGGRIVMRPYGDMNFTHFSRSTGLPLDKSSHMCYNKDTKELRQRMCRCREAPIEYRRQENKRIRLQDSCVRFLLF